MATVFEDMDSALSVGPHGVTHGETVTYVSSVSGSVSAVVLPDYGPLTTVPTDPTSRLEYEFAVRVPKSTVSRIVIGTDTVAMNRRTDGYEAMSPRTVKALLGQDGAYWYVAI